MTVAGGTIWNYFVLRSRFIKLSRLYKPNIKDEEVEALIKTSELMTSDDWFNNVKTMSKVETTLENYHKTMQVLTCMFSTIYNISTLSGYERVIDYMDTQLEGDYKEIIDLLSSTIDLWPGIVEKKVGDKNE